MHYPGGDGDGASFTLSSELSLRRKEGLHP